MHVLTISESKPWDATGLVRVPAVYIEKEGETDGLSDEYSLLW